MEYEPATLPLDLFAAGRALAYLATLTLVGACAFVALIPRWRDPADDEQSLAARALARAWRLAAAAAAVLLIANLGRGFGQLRSFLDPGEPMTWPAARLMLIDSAWGHGWLAQLATTTVALMLILVVTRRPAVRLALVGTAVLAVVGSTPLTGHAGEHPWGASFGIGLHAVHLLGGGLWLGTLATLAVAALPLVGGPAGGPPRDHGALARLVGAFSPLALVGAGLAIGAGLVLGYAYVGSLSALTSTAYGRALLVKSALLLLTLALGAWNWRRVSPTLGRAKGSARLRRSVTAELAIGLLLVATTAVLVALPAPGL